MGLQRLQGVGAMPVGQVPVDKHDVEYPGLESISRFHQSSHGDYRRRMILQTLRNLMGGL